MTVALLIFHTFNALSYSWTLNMFKCHQLNNPVWLLYCRVLHYSFLFIVYTRKCCFLHNTLWHLLSGRHWPIRSNYCTFGAIIGRVQSYFVWNETETVQGEVIKGVKQRQTTQRSTDVRQAVTGRLLDI